MNEEQKAIAEEIFYMLDQEHIAPIEALHAMAALLQELVDAPEPKSCGWIRAIDEAMVTHHLGVADIVDDYEAAKKKLNTLLSLNQDIGEYFSAKAPAPSVPDEQLQAAFDRGLKAGNEQAIAQQIEIHKLHDLLAVQQPEQPTDLARDAERYRWLRDKCRATGEHWGGRWSLVIEGPCPDGDESSGAIDKAIDAARERQEGGDQATLRDCATKGRAVMVGGGTIKCEVLPDGGQS